MDDQQTSGKELDRILTDHPEQTYYLRMCDDSMCGIGITKGDVLAVDCKSEPEEGDLVLVCLYGREMVIRLWEYPFIIAVPYEGGQQVFTITPSMDLQIIGVVISLVRRLRR